MVNLPSYSRFVKLGFDTVPSFALTLPPIPATRTFVDMFPLQNYVKPDGIGEIGEYPGGIQEGWCAVTASDPVNQNRPTYTIDLLGFENWVKAQSMNMKTLAVDIEPNNGEFDFHDEKTKRVFRLMMGIAAKFRPDVKLSFYCEGGCMYGGNGAENAADNFFTTRYRDDQLSLSYGLDDNGNIVRSRGFWDALNIISIPVYESEENRIKARIDASAAAVLPNLQSGQRAGIWLSVIGDAIANDFGGDWYNPKPARIIAITGSHARRAGFTHIFNFGYESDMSHVALGVDRFDPAFYAARAAWREANWQTKWRPAVEQLYLAAI